MSIRFPKLTTIIEPEGTQSHLRDEMRDFLERTKEQLDRMRTQIQEIEQSKAQDALMTTSNGDAE